MNSRYENVQIGGQTIAEFAIVCPIIILILLCTIQLVLLINAHQAVKMAAYKAARSLIVNVNRLDFQDVRLKMQKSAALSLIEISPVMNTYDSIKISDNKDFIKTAGAISTISMLKGISSLKQTGKYMYADRYTKVDLLSPENPAQIHRGTNVSVKVEYSFRLTVPVAKDIFYAFRNGFKGSSFHLFKNYKTVKIEKTAVMKSEN